MNPTAVQLVSRLKEWLSSAGMSEVYAELIKTAVVIAVILLIAYIANFLVKKILLVQVRRFLRKSKSSFNAIIIEKKILKRLANFAPALIIYYTIPFALESYPEIVPAIHAIIYAVMVLLLLLAVDALINVLHDFYNTLPMAREKNIKAYVQILKVFIYFLGGIVILSVIIGKSPLVFLGGLGAMSAVLMLVFKDTILGFVAGIQASANNLVKVGDWIEMASRNADGPVIDITVNTVKVRNWDKTISSFPAYALISESFINWRGMEESGGRRIKRSVYIDLKSVKFCTPEMLERFKKIQILHDYIEKKEKELDEYNKKHGIDESVLVNGRRQTNLGVFRQYVTQYLRRHPKIHNDMTFLVRHLQPTERGVPIEIFVFSKEQAWPVYESLQADIFDHIISVVPEFGLRVFQNPTGDDFRKLGELAEFPSGSKGAKSTDNRE